MKKINDLRIAKKEIIPTPYRIMSLNPVSQDKIDLTVKTRKEIEDILFGVDNRYFFIVGPCSIHNPESALEYAGKLKMLSDKVKDKILLVMRVYFEKPRTITGWKGLINDPYMNNTYNMEAGLNISRKLVLDILDLGMPISNEALDPVVVQYLDDVTSWSAIGARTVESQTHRQMASGLSCPVGLKNPTNGDLTIAINSIASVKESHNFIAMDHEGRTCLYTTTGNQSSHLVLRGGASGPNYDEKTIKECEEKLAKAGLVTKIMVDCSHDNSYKDHRNQSKVLLNCLEQIKNGNKSICSFMIESNLEEGNQAIPKDPKDLKYGVSITDKCISWNETEELMMKFYESI